MVISRYNKIFEIEGKSFVYNLSSKALLEIDNDIKSFLENKTSNIDEEIKNVLYNNGIVTESYEFELGRMINNMNNVKYDKKRPSVFLSLTSSCNLNCVYCYQDARKDMHECNQFLTPKNWTEIFGYLKKLVKDMQAETLTVFLFGGEPMLKSSLLESYIKEIKTIDTRVILVLITNGTLFNNNNVDFYCRNIDSIQITMDGMKEIHDKLKPYMDGRGSFDDILNNIKLLEQHGVQELTLRINLNQNTLLSVYQFVDFLCDNGINKDITAVKFAPIFASQNEILGCNHSIENNLLPESLGDLYVYAAKKGLRTFKDFDNGLCVGKVQNGCSIDEKLNVYACPGVLYQEPSAVLRDNEIVIKDEKWYEFLNNDSDCIKECEYAPICFGGCKWSKECNRKLYEAAFEKILQAYVISFYL